MMQVIISEGRSKQKASSQTNRYELHNENVYEIADNTTK